MSQPTRKAVDLNFATSMFGPIKTSTKRRLLAYYKCPCRDHWQDCYSIILNGQTMMTVWQAVIEIDTSFPRMGPKTDQHGLILEDWSAIPELHVFKEAIYFATH